MQGTAGEHIGPSGQVLILGEVEHGHDGLGAPRQNGQLVFVFVKDGLPCIDDIHGHVALHDLAQHFGLLVEFVMRFMVVEELLNALDAVIACGCVGFQPVQHAAGIFEARCVVEVNQAVVAIVDEGFFDMARGRGRIFYFAEGAVAQKRA